MLRVSENGRFLVNQDGSPFFYLGDTAWSLLQRLRREEVDRFLEDRATKGFTALQVVGVSEFDGLTVGNAYGDVPFHNLDPAKPNEAYFRHVDYVVEKAESLGMYIALLPTWGDKVGPLQWGTGPEVFDPEKARSYGEYLGRRYREGAVIWVIGGDRDPTEERHYATWRALAEGLDRGDGGAHLMTFHPQGGSSASDFFHEDPWLDFNMQQSGHGAYSVDNYNRIAGDYARTPAKPCMDGEPCYEDHPVRQGPEGAYFDAYDARKLAYWALFAGAHGHTYGANGVFQFWTPDQEDRFGVRRPWQEAMNLPASVQMQHARRLLESRPFLTRVPDQSLLRSDPGTGGAHVRATRASDGSYALVYTPLGEPVRVDMAKLSGEAAIAYWYDPRDGSARRIESLPADNEQEFTPPSSGPGNDWVLVLDDAARGFGTPGEDWG
jgi:hypothetical protein